MILVAISVPKLHSVVFVFYVICIYCIAQAVLMRQSKSIIAVKKLKWYTITKVAVLAESFCISIDYNFVRNVTDRAELCKHYTLMDEKSLVLGPVEA